MGGGGVSGSQMNTGAGTLANIASGGPANMAAAMANANAAGQSASNFYRGLQTGGLPFYRNMTDYGGGQLAQAFAPQYGAIARAGSQFMNTPSGFNAAQRANLGAQQATAFDNMQTQAEMANQQAKMQGAAGQQGEQQIYGGQGLGQGQLAAGSGQALLQGPQKPSGWGIAGGIAQAGLTAAAAF